MEKQLIFFDEQQYNNDLRTLQQVVNNINVHKDILIKNYYTPI